MTSAAQETIAAPRRRRRWLWWLLLLLVLVLLLALIVRQALQPDHAMPLLLQQAGKALGLEITADPGGRYRLRDLPMLEVRNVVAREPGSTVPVLKAARLYVAVPWSTLTSRGQRLDIERIELDAPELQLAAFQRWQAKRPTSTGPLPTLTRGIIVRDGRIVADGLRIDRLHIAIPHFAPTAPVRGPLRLRIASHNTRLTFDGAFALTRPHANAGLGLAGQLELITPDWRLPLTLRASAPLRIAGGEVRSPRLRLAAHGRYLSNGRDLPFALGFTSPLAYRHGAIGLNPAGIALRGDSVLPSLDAHGSIGVGKRLLLQLQGVLPHWPVAWPSLPAPIGFSRAPLPFQLDYEGRPNLADVAHLRLQREATRFDARFQLPVVLEWINAANTTSPLPPLDGTLSTPRLEIGGATLHGVEVDIDDPSIAPQP